MRLYEVIARGAERHPDRPAILFRDTALSYAALVAQVRRLASALAGRGIVAGDRVGVLLPNCPQATVAYYAATALGAVCVPANPLLKPAELAHIWGDSGVRLVMTAGPLLAGALEAQRELPGLGTVVSVGERDETPASVATYAELLAEGREVAPDLTRVDPHEPAVCIYTSGTTGRPKGALLSHRNLIVNCESVQAALRLGERDNFLCVLPLFHSFAATVCQNTSLFCGARFTIVESFHPGRVVEAILTHGVTVFPGVPAMFGALLQVPPERLVAQTSLRLCVSGGAPMPLAVMAAFEKRFGIPLIEGDGPTECSPVTSVNPLDGVRKPGTIGLPIPGVEMRIFDDHDRELPVDEIGEIVVRGENVMLGYHNQPEATAEALRGGWYHTGDLGKRDADGYFSIVDRKKDMIIVGGINVYPREVEEVLYTHPAVADAAVLGMPDALRGEVAAAVVVLKGEAQASGAELAVYCRDRLANFKVPRKVVFRESLPRGSTGKVLKRLLRKEMEMEAAGGPPPEASALED
jgi:long-chain acyl-CoA synthetase